MGDQTDETKLERVSRAILHGAAVLHRNMGLQLLECSSSRTVITMPYSDDFRGAAENSIHGGALAALADIACAFTIAPFSDEEEVEFPVTTDLHIRFFGQPRSWPITASAGVVRNGRRLKSLECVIADADERELARATATYMMVPAPPQGVRSDLQ